MRFCILVVVLLLGIGWQISADSDLFQEARLVYNQAKFAEAIDIYERLIRDNPKEFRAYLDLAYLYKDLAAYKQAAGVVRRALQFIKHERLKMLLGQLYYLDGKPRQAISQLKQLLPDNSRDARLLLYLGLCYEDIGNLAEAQALYSRAASIKPGNAQAYLRLGNIYYQKQNLNKAAQIYQKVIALDPSLLEVRSRLAESLAGSGKLAEAYKQYAKCVAVYPQDKLLKEGLEGVKARLGDEFFKQKQVADLQRRRIKSIQVKPSPSALSAPLIRVEIARTEGSIEFKTGSPFELIDKQSREVLWQGEQETIYSLVFNQQKAGLARSSISQAAGIQLKDSQSNFILTLDRAFLIKNKSHNSVISIFDIPVGQGSFWAGWHDQQYRGEIEVIPDQSSLQLVNLINLEGYLYSVLASEMPADWPKQALCTQAIAARTWAMRNKSRHNRQGFNFCDTVHCQAYKGAGAETKLTNQAVDETAGLILACDDQPVDMFYSNNCGGITQDGVADARYSDFSFPFSPSELEEWLSSEPDTFCNLKQEKKSYFRWTRCYNREQLQSIINRAGINIGQLLEVIPQRRADSGHLLSIKIRGTGGSRVIQGEYNIRKTLGDLLSSAFKIETKLNSERQPVEFVFYGGGFGHGRGLCQAGLKGMALEGYNYRQILEHYYPKAQIKKIY
jgi:stage II sporulation protein D